MPTFENVATPATAVAVIVPTVVAPLLTDIVTTVVLSVVRVFPAPSRTATTGWVTNAAPLADPDALVVSTSCVPAPTVGTMVCDAGASPALLNVNVYVVPAVPLMPAEVNVANPAADV